MNFLQHRQESRGHVLPMPEGLQELMGDISREVLRCQPSVDCTYKFIADYLEAMVNTRDKSKIAMSVIDEAILKTDEVYSQFAKCHFPKDKTNSFLDMMEITFRRFVDQKRKRKQDPRFITFHADDMLEELMRKCDLTKVEILRSRPAIQWAYSKFVNTYLDAIEGTLDTEALYLDSEKLLASSKELRQMNDSAVQIQKAFRGYQTRKFLQKSHRVEVNEPTDSSSSSSFQKTKKSVVLRPPGTMPSKLSSDATEACLLTFETVKDSQKLTTKLNKEKAEDITRPLHNTEDSAREPKETIEEIIKDKDVYENLKELNEAVVKIQASFKGYKVRKELHDSHLAKHQGNHQNIPPEEHHVETSKHSM